jgi:uncharacterized membrane protein YjdF
MIIYITMINNLFLIVKQYLSNIIALISLFILIYSKYLYNNKKYILSSILFIIFGFMYSLNNENRYNLNNLLYFLSIFILIIFKHEHANTNKLFYKILVNITQLLIPLSLILFILETTFDIFKNPKK